MPPSLIPNRWPRLFPLTMKVIEIFDSMILGLLLIVLFNSSCEPARSGKQLYFSFFGGPTENCVEILNSQDHQAFDDASAWLSFKTCSSELHRILSQKIYSKRVISKDEAHSDETATYGGQIPNWWTPSSLGDSCIKYEWFSEEENTARHLYVSFDQKSIYCRDMTMTP